MEKIPPKRTSKIEAIEKKIMELGRDAFLNGLPQEPVTDMDFIRRLSDVTDTKSILRASDLWSRGWLITQALRS